MSRRKWQPRKKELQHRSNAELQGSLGSAGPGSLPEGPCDNTLSQVAASSPEGAVEKPRPPLDEAEADDAAWPGNPLDKSSEPDSEQSKTTNNQSVSTATSPAAAEVDTAPLVNQPKHMPVRVHVLWDRRQLVLDSQGPAGHIFRQVNFWAPDRFLDRWRTAPNGAALLLKYLADQGTIPLPIRAFELLAEDKLLVLGSWLLQRDDSRRTGHVPVGSIEPTTIEVGMLWPEKKVMISTPTAKGPRVYTVQFSVDDARLAIHRQDADQAPRLLVQHLAETGQLPLPVAHCELQHNGDLLLAGKWILDTNECNWGASTREDQERRAWKAAIPLAVTEQHESAMAAVAAESEARA